MRQQIRQTTPIPARASAAYPGAVTRQINTEPRSDIRLQRNRSHWLTPIGCGALLVLACVFIWTFWIVPLYTTTLTHWHYRDAHITRLTADIGRGSEDFIAYDSSGQVMVLEVNKAHPEKTHLYTGIALLSDSGTTIITLSLADVKHNGTQDLIVTVNDQHYVLFNKGDSLSWSDR